ncbi:MAG: glycosyltransferase family 2 protein [Phycisphaerae bacterium]|nr:glycosyltransferase family 2 protein [Phycisphaerae bacterium]
MTSRPDVSIVIPCHNAADFISATLQSIQAQTLPDWEAVCVDDGSTDGTANVLTQAAGSDPRIRVVQTTHRGAGAARNLGLRHAEAEHVLFFDSDDLLQPFALEMLMRVANTCGPDCMVTGGYELLDRNGRPLNIFRFPCGGRMSLDDQLRGNTTTVVALFRKDYLGPDPFDTSLPACIDEGLWLNLASRHTNCCVLPRAIFGRRLRCGSIAHHADNRFAAGCRLYAQWLPKARDPDALRDRVHRFAFFCGALAFAGGRPEALDTYLSALPPTPIRDGFHTAAAGSLLWAFLFTYGADGHTWRTRARSWTADIEAWLEAGPLEEHAARILAALEDAVDADHEPARRVDALFARRPDATRLVIYGLGTNGRTLLEHLRRASGPGTPSLAVADDHADELTFALLGLPREDPRRWRQWPEDTAVLITPNDSQSMVDRLLQAGGRPGHDFVNVSTAACRREPVLC